jgi:S1-C subfamily serine protease
VPWLGPRLPPVTSYHRSFFQTASTQIAVALLAVAAVQSVTASELAKETPEPKANAPVWGQPFDDREIVRHLEAEGRKLLAAKRISPIRPVFRRCNLPLPAAGRQKLQSPQLASQAEAATVVLGEFFREEKQPEIQFASAAGGFFVGPRGTLVTSLHVISEKESRGFVAMTRDGRVFPIREAVAANPAQDLVALQLDSPETETFPSLSLAPAPAPLGAPIMVMSHPDEHFWMLTTGVISRNTVWRGERGDEFYTCITADYAKGSSGCPVLDDCGNVVGIVNNTESVYYDDDGKKKQMDLQMVIKNTTPGWVARTLFQPPTP